MMPMTTGASTTPSRPQVSHPFGFLKGSLQSCQRVAFMGYRYMGEAM